MLHGHDIVAILFPYMAYIFSTLPADFIKAHEWLAKEYSQLHTGRATPMILDSIMVESYGSMMPIKNIASISIEDSRTLRIAPWDKSSIKSIEKAIQTSNTGLSVVSDSDGVRAIFPMLTTENRQKLVKIVKEKLEDARITVRKTRDGIMKDIEQKEKDGDISEDERFRAKEQLQQFTNDINAKLEDTAASKEKEVMTV